MFTPFLYGALAAGGLTAVVLLASRGRSLGAAAIGLGYAAGQAAVFGLPPIPITDSTHWLFWTGVVGAAASVVATARSESRTAALAPALVLAPASVFLAVRPRVQWAWSTGEAVAWIAGLSMGVAVFAWGLVSLSHRHSGWRFSAAMTAGAAALTALLAATGSLLLAALSFSLATALAVQSLLGRVLGIARVPADRALAPALLLPVLWIHGYCYAETPAWSAALFALVPAAAAWTFRPTSPCPGSAR